MDEDPDRLGRTFTVERSLVLWTIYIWCYKISMDILHSTSVFVFPTFLRPPGLHEAIDGGAVQHAYIVENVFWILWKNGSDVTHTHHIAEIFAHLMISMFSFCFVHFTQSAVLWQRPHGTHDMVSCTSMKSSQWLRSSTTQPRPQRSAMPGDSSLNCGPW